jgi:hypothetical protein
MLGLLRPRYRVNVGAGPHNAIVDEETVQFSAMLDDRLLWTSFFF